MVIRLRIFAWVAIWVCALASGALSAAGQNTSSDVPPAIDVYAMDESFPGIRPMCPNETRFFWHRTRRGARLPLGGMRRTARRSSIRRPRASI